MTALRALVAACRWHERRGWLPGALLPDVAEAERRVMAWESRARYRRARGAR